MSEKTTNWTPDELREIQEQKRRDDAKAYVHCKVCSSVVTIGGVPYGIGGIQIVGMCACKEGPTL